MDKTFDAKTTEAHWTKTWEAEGYNRPQESDESYCIMLPPPNVTGSLHMGHGFQVALMDCLIRYHRMQGKQTLWQAGVDHAGIATQMVVERQLLQQNKTRHDLGREKFLEAIWNWKEHSGGTITKQLRLLGASLDWDRERFTMDPGFSKAVSELFVKLFDDNKIYRGEKLVNWDPKLGTAISDLEVINVEKQGNLWHIRYPLTDSNDYLIVATTRPETLFGDAAICVHPDDKRYQHLIGKTVNLPLCDRTIPIIADEYVDPEFGSGCVKITPAHDFNDYDVGKRHQLPLINIMTPEACMTNVPSKFEGLTREEARKATIIALKESELLEKIQPHTHKVPMGDRSGVVIEPYLTKQWFVACTPLAKEAIDVVKDGRIQFHPKNYENTYFHWLENIQDWCISRQLWWGHRIPAWYDADGNVYVARSEAEVRSKYQLADDLVLNQDDDVLDTWFSSALWPFATLGWPEKTKDMDTFFPTSVLVTGHDIIFYWVARMIMMSLYCNQEIPFRDVFITGLIRDEHNQKMSKSKGNVIDPLDLVNGISLEDLLQKRTTGLMQPKLAESIKKNTIKSFPEGISPYGTDAVRFTYCALATTGRDVRFDLQRLEGYRNFCNKLWNAARFVLSQCDSLPKKPAPKELHIADRWIYDRLEHTKTEVNKHISQYRFDLLATTLYEFVWRDYCDWYIELCKKRLQEGDLCAQYTLMDVLEQTVRLLHPITPFITEAIWQNLKEPMQLKPASIMLTSYPKVTNEHYAEVAEPMQWLQNIVTGIRTMRAEMHISPAIKLPITLAGGNNDHNRQHTQIHGALIAQLAKTEAIVWQPTPPTDVCAKYITNHVTIYLPLAGLVDKDTEINRVNKAMRKIEKQAQKLATKLANTYYCNNAPQDVINSERQQLKTWQVSIQHYEEHLNVLARL